MFGEQSVVLVVDVFERGERREPEQLERALPRGGRPVACIFNCVAPLLIVVSGEHLIASFVDLRAERGGGQTEKGEWTVLHCFLCLGFNKKIRNFF